MKPQLVERFTLLGEDGRKITVDAWKVPPRVWAPNGLKIYLTLDGTMVFPVEEGERVFVLDGVWERLTRET